MRWYGGQSQNCEVETASQSEGLNRECDKNEGTMCEEKQQY